MAAVCPNINSPEWKSFVAKHGEEQALKLYAQNGYKVPAVRRVDMNPRPIGRGYLLNGSAVRQKLSEDPKLAKKIIESLNQSYPWIKLNPAEMFDIDEQWNQFPPGHKGMHYRSAIISAVAWSNEATMDTPPHEYAHEYIQMFASTPMVRAAINKYGEENLVSELGKFYARKKAANWFENFIDDLFYSVKKVFGNPDVSEILARNYYKGKRLGTADYKRSGYKSWQKTDQALLDKVEEIKENSSFIWSSDKDGNKVSGSEATHYYNSKTGKLYERVTSYITNKQPEENDYLKSASVIGTKADDFVRDFFANELKPYSSYDLASAEQMKEFQKQLEKVRNRMKRRKETVLANDIVLYDDTLGIAGTVDLLTYDAAGNFRIYDMKTMRGGDHRFMQHQSGPNKGKSKYDYGYDADSDSNREKHKKQLSMYRILLNNTHGVKAKTVGIMPIQVMYQPGETRTEMLKLSKKGIEHTPYDQVKGAALDYDKTTMNKAPENEQKRNQKKSPNHREKKTGSGFNPDPARYIESDVSEYFMTTTFIKDYYRNTILPEFMTDGTLDVEAFAQHVFGNIDRAADSKMQGLRRRNRPDANPQGFDDDLLVQMRDFFKGEGGKGINEVNLNNLARWLAGEDTQLDSTEQKMFNQFKRMHQAIGIYFDEYSAGSKPQLQGYQSAVVNNLFTRENKMTPLQNVVDDVMGEINQRFESRHAFGENFKAKYPKGFEFLKKLKLDNISVRWLYDAHLLAFSLTGKNNSTFSKLFDQSLNHGVNVQAEIDNKLIEITAKGNQIPNYNNWGRGDVDKKSINEYETVNLKSIDGTNVTLTMNEAASLYLNLKQGDTRAAIIDHGFYISDPIIGRTLSITTPVKLQLSSIQEIEELFENNSDNKLFVEMIRESMDYLYDKTNEVFKQLQGDDLQRRENFFPAFYGEVNYNQRTKKRITEEFKSTHERLGGDMPVRIGDVKMVFNSHGLNASIYAAYALPIRNNRMVLNKIRNDYASDNRIKNRLDMVEGFLNRIEDSGLLYSSQGEKKGQQLINQAMSNFSVFVLGYNQFVVVKQTASYMAAQEYIPVKYLKEAGQGIGMFAIPKLDKFFKALQTADKSQDLDTLRKLLPIEYNLSEDNESYQEIMEHSAYLTHRFRGHSHRELSEALMDRFKGKDEMVFKIFGKEIKLSKTRAMEGIRVMDAVTVMDIWKATKLWTNERIETGELNIEKGSADYWEQITQDAEEAIKRTQPVSDVVNRSWLSSNKDTLSRTATMFSSATQQIGKLVLKRMMEYNADPSVENRKRLTDTMFRSMFMTAMYVTAIDMIKAMALYGFDEPDDVPQFVLGNVVNNMAGYFHGFGLMIRQITSRIDDQPWTSSMQHPVETLIDDASNSIAYMVKGEFGKAFRGGLEVFMQTKGIPINPLKTTEKIVGRFQ
jgi:hypothetical protein